MLNINAVPVSLPFDDFEPEFFIDEETQVPSVSESIKQNETECQIPTDKNSIVYGVFYLLGTSILLPWFFFITCNDYWMYRFRDLKNYTNEEFDIHLDESGSNRTKLQADFTAYISIASTVPSTIFLFFNVIYLHRYSIHWRIMISSAVILFCFIETTLLVLFDTDTWQLGFFVTTIVTVIILNMASAMLQAALCAIFIKFPLTYISAFSSGQSLCGIVSSLSLLLTLATNISPTSSTFLYFIFGDLTILLSFIAYLLVKRSDFFLYFAEDIGEYHISSTQYNQLESENNDVVYSPPNYTMIQKRIWIPSVTLFFCYIVTASVYPSIAVLVCSCVTGKHSAWNDKYFVPVITYLLYCTCEYIGRISAGLFQKPKGLGMLWMSLLRFVFIPLMMLCNAQPRHNLPVIFHSDWIYILIVILFALSNGYISTLVFLVIPGLVLSHQQEVASTMLVTWLGISLSIGSIISFPLVNSL